MNTQETSTVWVSAQGAPCTPRVSADGRRFYAFGAGEAAGQMEIVPVFPGIDLVYHSFAMRTCDCGLRARGSVLAINYCQTGQEECEWLCGDHLYLGPGDLCITRLEDDSPILNFPTGRYAGVTVLLNLDTLHGTPPPLLDSAALNLAAFPDRFCPGHHFFAMRANAQIAHLFSELFEIPDAVRADYRKIKVLELLLFLSVVDPAAERRIEKMTAGQIEVVRAVQERLCADLRENLTIAQLAKEFCISPTALKTHFRMVYHDSIKEFLRKARMERAAVLLRQADARVAEIAAEVGYVSQSKFAAAFKAQFGLTPLAYRRKCTHAGAQETGS